MAGHSQTLEIKIWEEFIVNKKLINYMGLLGIISLISYTAAVIFSPLAYPGYNWMAQAVSDLSAETAPSKQLWGQLAALYGKCGIVSSTCACIYLADSKAGSKIFRVGVYLFTIMNWVSGVGYAMFPLNDAGKEIASFQEVMHIVVTALVVLLSIVSLAVIIVAGCKRKSPAGIGVWAAAALVMMFIGAIGINAVPAEYMGIAERFSVFSATGFNAVLGWYLYTNFKDRAGEKNN